MTSKMDVARGLDSRLSARFAAGRVSSIDTSEHDLWGGAESVFGTTKLMQRPVAFESGVLSLVSDSADDAAAGTGARSVRVRGISSTLRTEVEEVVTLAGVTQVNTTTTFVGPPNSVEVETVGSVGVNVGNVSVRAPSTALVAALPAGVGRAPMARFTAPVDRYVHVERVWAWAWVTCAFTLYAQRSGGAAIKLVESYTASLDAALGMPWRFDPGTTLWMSALASAGTTHACGGFDLMLESV